MRLLFALTLLMTGCSLHRLENPKMISIMEQSGVAYVGAPDLERVAHIAVKRLQDNDVVVCSGERCALVKDFIRKGDEIWVSAVALAESLGLNARFSADRTSVTFVVAPREVAAGGSPARIGQLAPNFRVARLDGGTVSLADFRGKRVLINSWASWWSCRNDLPVWQEFYEKHHGQAFELLSIAVDVQGPGMVTPYTRKFGVTFPVAVDSADVFGQLFDLKAIPVTFLVDEVGIIRLQGGGPNAALLRQIETVLEEPVAATRGSMPQLAPARPRDELEKIVARTSDDWRARFALARDYDAEGRFVDAVSQLEAAATLQPRESSIPFLWGLVLLHQNQKENALTKLKLARDLDPENWRIHKQIWAIEHPEKFYTRDSPDFGWQKEELAREKDAKKAQ